MARPILVDIGNTTIHVGLFDGEAIERAYRFAADVQRTSHDYASALLTLLHQDGVTPPFCHLVACSVVPPLGDVVEAMGRAYLSDEVVLIEHGEHVPIPVRYEAPQEVGADRLVDAYAAVCLYGDRGPIVVVDFGTATTFDVVTRDGAYQGGVIAPGVLTSAEALFQKAAKLPRVDVRKPARVVGRNTVESMRSGLFHGFISQVDGMVERIEQELGESVFCVATGGLARTIAPHCSKVDELNPELTLQGLRLIHEQMHRS